MVYLNKLTTIVILIPKHTVELSLLRFLLAIPHKFSIGLRYGEFAGHGMTLKLRLESQLLWGHREKTVAWGAEGRNSPNGGGMVNH